MSQIQPVPGPSQDAFNALSEQIGNLIVQETYNKHISEGTSEEWFGNYAYTYNLSKTGYKIISASISASGCGKGMIVRNFNDTEVIALALGGQATSTGTLYINCWYKKTN